MGLSYTAMTARTIYTFPAAVTCVVLIVLRLTYNTMFTYKPYNHRPPTDVFARLPSASVISPEAKTSKHAANDVCYAGIRSVNYLSAGYSGQCVYNCRTGLPVRMRRNHTGIMFSVPLSIISTESDEHRRQAFVTIFKKDAWGDSSFKDTRHVSGPGSVLNKTSNVRGTLAAILDGIKSVLNKERLRMLDVPCGDFSWMSRFLSGRNDVIYTGIDIVPDLIRSLQKRYSKNPRMSFHVRDIAMEPMVNQYDLIFSRHMTQHLTNGDTMRTLAHISTNQTSYLLMTTYPSWLNTELLYGTRFRFRSQNLEMPPYSLIPPLCQSYDGDTDVTALWRLPLKQVQSCRKPQVDEYESDTFGRRVYTCL